MDSSFTRPLVCSFYFLLSSATLYLSFAYYHSKSRQILNAQRLKIIYKTHPSKILTLFDVLIFDGWVFFDS